MGSLTQGQDRFHNTLIVEQMIQLKESTPFIIGKYGGMASRAGFSSILSISKIDISLSVFFIDMSLFCVKKCKCAPESHPPSLSGLLDFSEALFGSLLCFFPGSFYHM